MKTIGTCKDCKWWEKDEHWGDNVGICQSPKIADPAIDAQAFQCTDKYEDILTGPDFGCVHWEEKA